MQKRKNPYKLENLRGQIKAGLEALERGEFTEVADADLERYVNDLVSLRKRRSLSADIRHCERSEAIQLRGLDCFVAPLLAMTAEQIRRPFRFCLIAQESTR